MLQCLTKPHVAQALEALGGEATEADLVGELLARHYEDLLSQDDRRALGCDLEWLSGEWEPDETDLSAEWRLATCRAGDLILSAVRSPDSLIAVDHSGDPDRERFGLVTEEEMIARRQARSLETHELERTRAEEHLVSTRSYAAMFDGTDLEVPKSIARFLRDADKDATTLEEVDVAVPPKSDAYASSDEEPIVTASEPESRPVIEADNGDLEELTDQSWVALAGWNTPPTMFRFGSLAHHLETSDDGRPVMTFVDSERMLYALARAATWLKTRNGIIHKAHPPRIAATQMLATPDAPLPKLDRIVSAPVFAADGSLRTEPGYHPQAHTLYVANDETVIPDVPDAPSVSDVERAKDLILGEMLVDFPFAGDADRAHALSLYLLMYARGLISGVTPLHLVGKPTIGTGASLLVSAISIAATGTEAHGFSIARDEDETSKLLTAIMSDGHALATMDNASGYLDSAKFARLLTEEEWSGRILGKSKTGTWSNKVVWSATANNLSLSAEIARRTVHIRLDAGVARPMDRTGFRHDPLREWIRENRGALVWSALVLVRAWVVAGRPSGSAKPIGSFEEWSRVMGGILDVAGVPGFLENTVEMFEASTPSQDASLTFIAYWLEQHGEKLVTPGDLYAMATHPTMTLDLGRSPMERSEKSALAALATSWVGAVFDLDVQTVTVGRERDKRRKTWNYYLKVKGDA